MKDRAQGAIKMPFKHKGHLMWGTPINLKWWKFKQWIKNIIL
jgi:hypothetical protein